MFPMFMGPLHGVKFSVEIEAGALAKGFVTFAAFIGSFSSVNYLVLKNRLLPKGFSTLATLVRSCTSVNTVVLNEAGASTKAFLTFTTLIWPFSSMNSLVFCEDGSSAK